MGEEYGQIYGGKLSLFVGGKPIEIPPITDADIHIEESGTEFKTMWPVGTGAFEVSFTASIKDDAPIMRFVRQMKECLQRGRKKMLWAVTHGFVVEIKGNFDENGETVLARLNRPSQVRRFFRHCGFLPEFRIVDKHGVIVKKIKKVCIRN